MSVRVLLLVQFFLLALASWAEEVPAAAPAAGIVITMRQECVSQGDEVQLKELAELSGVPAERTASVEQTVVGRAPQPGQNRSFTQQDVLTAIKKTGWADAFEVRGAPAARVTAAAQEVAKERLAETAAAAAKAYFEKDPDLEVETEVAGVMACPPVRPGPVELGADLAEAELRVGVQSVRVRVMQNGRRAAEAMARVKVRVTGTLTVAAERLSAGDVLTESGYRTIRREFTANDLRARCDPRKLVGMVAKRNIAPDEPLTKALFALPQVIKRGEAVTVLVKRGALELTTQGEARNDAALDDPVRVFLVDSHSEIVARASGARQATLDDPLAGRQK